MGLVIGLSNLISLDHALNRWLGYRSPEVPCNLIVSTLQVKDDQDCETQGSMILPFLAVESIFVQIKGKLTFRLEN